MDCIESGRDGLAHALRVVWPVFVPIVFKNDHIGTLYELDLGFGKEAREVRSSLFSYRSSQVLMRRGQLGMEPGAESLRDSQKFTRAFADIMMQCLQ